MTQSVVKKAYPNKVSRLTSEKTMCKACSLQNISFSSAENLSSLPASEIMKTAKLNTKHYL